ncbi:MAG: septum formation protein Maf [Deltaproteobacteria bacterium]|nr:septum formation protein Maf [Deltaproteobacteria bacterium]
MKPISLILASTSPRRQELLSTLGVSFRVVPPIFMERPIKWLGPREEAAYLAYHKAMSLVPRFPAAWILACDTLVAFEGKKWGKPRNKEDAVNILLAMSGKWHQVWTALALYQGRNPAGLDRSWQHWEEVSEVHFKKFSEQEARDYVETGEAMGKAGAYAIQGLGVSLVEEICGEKENIIGLPLKRLSSIVGLRNQFHSL